MNKHVKISLIVLIVVILMLVIAIPGLARDERQTYCLLSWRAHYEKDNEDISVIIPGDIGELVFNGSILTKTCTGNIPLGGTRYNPKVVYYTLEEMREYLCETYGDNNPEDPACNIGDEFIIGPDEKGGEQYTIIYKGEQESETWSLVVYEDEPGYQDGDFELVSVFDIE